MKLFFVVASLVSSSSTLLVASANPPKQPWDASADATNINNFNHHHDSSSNNNKNNGHSRASRDSIIVSFKDDVSSPSFLPGTNRRQRLYNNIYSVSIPLGLSRSAAVRKYQYQSDVKYSELNWKMNLLLDPNDPLYVAGDQWDMTLIEADKAWDIETDASDVIVAVIDTGIQFNHPDLVDNIYVDHPGYVCFSGVCLPDTDPQGSDDHGHGTHVAGTIGASGNNGIGVTGVNWKVKLLSIKFLDNSGSGFVEDAIQGFAKLLQLKNSGVNIRVTNNSWGGGGYSQSLKDVMHELELTGVVNVCAAGNTGGNVDINPQYPAAYDNGGLISVLATTKFNTSATFTSFGRGNTDIAAPGLDILSTAAGFGEYSCSLCSNEGYRTLSGTSMASPHVAGAAALLLQLHPNLNAYEARDVILHPNSYDQVAVGENAEISTTGGRLNLFKILNNTDFLNNLVLNNPPVVTIDPDFVVLQAGESASFQVNYYDPDRDNMSVSENFGQIEQIKGWMLAFQANRHLLPFVSSPLNFQAPSVGRMIMYPYSIGASDYRGGGGSATAWAVVNVDNNSVQPGPTGTLMVQSNAMQGENIDIVFQYDPHPTPWNIYWDFVAISKLSSTASCCHQTIEGFPKTFWTGLRNETYQISVRAIDYQLNIGYRYETTLHVGDAVGTPPSARCEASVTEGMSPLDVTIDMSDSFDADGSIVGYCNTCGANYICSEEQGGWSQEAIQTCTFNVPGVYVLKHYVIDDEGLRGYCDNYIVVHPNLDPSPSPSSMPSGSSSPSEKSSVRPSLGPSDTVTPTEYPTLPPTPEPTLIKYFCSSSIDQSYCDETQYPTWYEDCNFNCRGKNKSCLSVSCSAGPPPPTTSTPSKSPSVGSTSKAPIIPTTNPPTTGAGCIPGDGSRNSVCCDDSDCNSNQCKGNGLCK